MKNQFESFVNHIVKEWAGRKRTTVEMLDDSIKMVKSLSGVESNYINGVNVELVLKGYIETNIKKSKACITPASRTPADVYVLIDAPEYWHIMLIQVKSSINRDAIKKISNDDIEAMAKLAELILAEFPNYKPFGNSRNEPVVISTGYAGVFQDANDSYFIESTACYHYCDNFEVTPNILKQIKILQTLDF